MLLSSVAVVTGIVISISKQEYMFGYKVTSISKQEYMFGYKAISISKQEYMFGYKAISISKQEYMFGYKAPFVAVRVFLDLLINYVDARASVSLRSYVRLK
jgi:hypothetical protein